MEKPLRDLIDIWTERARAKLVGRKIVAVRYLNEKELEEYGWSSASLVIEFDDKNWIVVSTDDEGNGPGALFTSWEDLSTIPVV